MRLEDSITRLYRAIEIISQHRLIRYGIETKKPDYCKIPGIEEKYKELTMKLYDEEKSLPNEIGIKDGHILLFLLEDEIWKSQSIGDLKKFLEPIRLRDNSIIAHGIELIGHKAFENIEKTCKSFIRKLCDLYGKDFETTMKQHKFIKFHDYSFSQDAA
jgi:hypothetical protein